MPDLKTFQSLLHIIDIDIDETELSHLVDSFFLYKEVGSLTAMAVDSKVVLKDKVKNIHSEGGTWNFANFAKIVAILVDQEVLLSKEYLKC